jgi:hypothetical protein
MSRLVASVLALVLIALGAFRIGSLALQQPVIGYANQFDMGRTSACFGLWPDIAAPGRYHASREAPIARYTLDSRETRSDECYISTELLFTAAAIGAWKAAAAIDLANASTMDLRFVGGVKAATLVLFALLLTLALRQHPGGSLAHAAVFALVLADPVVTLWMNTLYTEFSAVLAFYVAVVALAMIVVEQPERPGWYVTFGLALLALGLSRQQHVLLPLFLFVLAMPAMWTPFRRAVGPLAFIAVAVVALQLFAIPRPASISSANNVNVVLGTLLPATNRQQQGIDVLGLPQSCGGVIGATWYVTMGEDLAKRCPDVMTIRRSQVINLLLADPLIIPAAFARMAPLAQPPLLHYVGAVAGARFGEIDAQPGINGVSAGTWIERLYPELYLGILWFVLLAFPLSMLAWARSTIRSGTPSLESTIGAALTGTIVYAFLSSMLGDGMVEVARHVHLANVSLLAMAVLLVAWMIHRVTLLAPSRAGSRPALVALNATAWYEWSVFGLAIVVASASPLWLTVWQSQPLAIGVVDEPESNRMPPNTSIVPLHGWAMDPFAAVQAFSIVNGEKRVESRPWQHPLDPRGVELARVLPTYRDPRIARFEIAIDLAPYGDQPVSVRTFARNRDGIITEIDRRVLTRAR